MAKVYRLLLTSALLCLLLRIFIPKGSLSLSFSLSFRLLGPLRSSLRLILSRVYLIVLTKSELSSDVVRWTLLANLTCRYLFFSRYTRRCKFLRPPIYPPGQTAENYLASPPRSSVFLHVCRACRFFTLRLILLLRKLFFATFSRLISLVTRQVTFSAIRITTREFSVLQQQSLSLDFLYAVPFYLRLLTQARN